MVEKKSTKSGVSQKLSLHPLRFRDAVSTILQVKPEPKSTGKKNISPKRKTI
jgi:hypothetical protein